MSAEKKHLLVIDANSLIHRAYHALPPLSTSKGQQVNAVYGFLLMLFKAIKEIQPDYIVAAFDTAAPTKRLGKFAEYKATRVKADDELYSQMPLVKKALEAFGISSFERDGYEADDILGTVAKRTAKSKKIATFILTGDSDAFQLVDSTTKVYTMRKGLQDAVMYGEKEVRERFGGLGPDQVVDYKGLRGDPSDNIPGVKGVGDKTAIQLLLRFGSLEGLYKALAKEDLEGIKPAVQKTLVASKEDAFMGRDLARIEHDVPITLSLRDIAWKVSDANGAEAYLREMEFQTLLSRFSELRGKTEPDSSAPENVEARIKKLYKEEVFSRKIYELEMALIPVLRSMEEAGIAINKKHFSALEKEVAKDITKLESRIYKKSGKEFNINSSQQLSEILFEKLKLSTKGLKKTPGGVISTAAEELEKLQGEHKIIEDLLLYRELRKLYTTYITPLPGMADEKGRIHTHFDQLGTATGRLSSSSPNLQNIPMLGEWGKRIRKGFVAEKGYQFVTFDYSQMELRLASYVAKEPRMQEAFDKGQDIHQMTAAEVFGIPLKKVTEEMRYRAKALNFGILYGMGEVGFSRSAHISREEAREFIEDYFARFPAILTYIEAMKEFVHRHGYTETIFGRRRYIPEINSRAPQLRAAAERMAVNMPLQGTAADIMKIAMVSSYQKIQKEKWDCRMLLQLHDELLFECSDDIIQAVEGQVKALMEEIVGIGVKMEVEVKQGPTWGDLKTV